MHTIDDVYIRGIHPGAFMVMVNLEGTPRNNSPHRFVICEGSRGLDSSGNKVRA
jgi:hypothetical protein